jgi:NAD(P)-dependent dehydrogenase (short-subunit alcohol dehydrogenase family)
MNLVITGTSAGIGRSLAAHLGAQGHEVWGLARSSQGALASGQNGRFHPIRCDVADWTQVESAVGQIAATRPHVDGLITCAGSQGEVGPAMTADPRRWSETVRINLDGTYNAVRGFYPLLRQAPRRAKVICFSGGGASTSRPNFSAYAAAKTAVVRLVETIAEELREEPIDLNALAPGAINTRMTDEVLALGPTLVGEAEYQTALKQKAAGGASMARVLACIDWLLGPESDGVSGRLLAAPWDPWPTLGQHVAALATSDVYTLRRIVPEEREMKF